jgi:predicted ATPase
MRDGGNIASVLDVLKREHADEFRQIIEMLSKVVPGISEVNVKHVLNFETLEFHQRVRSAANKEFLRFMALNMSDGTLRTLGVLTALVQARAAGRHRIPLIGIEEPETAIHPYAAAVMRDCIREAAYSTQVLVTSHSPELLDSPDIEPETVLTVGGYGDVNTVVQPLLPRDADLIREHLCTPGELFRQNQIAQAVDPGIGQTELPLGEGC